MQIVVDQEIILTQISQKFTQPLFDLVQQNRQSELCYWCPDLLVTYATIESTKFHIEDALSKFEEDKTPDFLILYKKELAGVISLSPVVKVLNKSEIGYWLGANFTNYGIITRSFPFILDYAKNTLHLSAVELSTSVPNTRSQKIPLKFNFKKIKVIPKAEILKDGIVDHILWRYEFR